MSTPSHTTWQVKLVEGYPHLFETAIRGEIVRPGIPKVGDGWRDLVETAIERIANAVAGSPRGLVRIGQIKEKYATLRVYLDSQIGLSEPASDAIDRAICLATARSACTCERCGAEGRLYKYGRTFVTSCDVHGRGKPVLQPRGLENLHITRGIVDGRRVIRTQRYAREIDSFVDVDPSSFDLDGV
jgi:hypothetical protein